METQAKLQAHVSDKKMSQASFRANIEEVTNEI
jgi:hypothetical protein